MLLSDNPIAGADQDGFGFRRYAETLCEAITAADDLPLTIGLYGPWGSGKSSFMNICRDLLDRGSVPTVGFNPWKYDRRDEVWHALIQTVLTEIQHRVVLERESSRAARIKGVLATAGRLSRTASWLLARRAVVPLTGGILASEDADAVQQAWGASGEEYRHVNEFEADFAEVVDTYTDGGRLVLFIDDLDRCTPDAAITVLDALKLFLGSSSCVFVLAMDHDVMVEAAALRLGGDPTRGRQYLEKLVQFPYHLPAVSFDSISGHVAGAVRESGADPYIWALAGAAFQRNPRRIRRFVNAFNVAVSLLDAGGPARATLIRQVAALLAVRIEFPEFYVRIVGDPLQWSRMDLAAHGERRELLSEETAFADRNPNLLRLLVTISPRSNADYPALPNRAVLEALTEVLTVTPGPVY